MKTINFLLKIILFAIGFASVIPHLIPNFWLTDIFAHFKLQYLILLLFLLLPVSLFLIKRKIIPVLFILLLLVWNSWFIIPLYLKDPQNAEASGEKFSILSINLLASNTNYSEALDLIKEKDPEVLILLELSPQWEEKIKDIYSLFPFRQMYPQQNNFGIGILSKTSMESSVTDLGSRFPPSILSMVEIEENKITILATHPVPPVNQEKFKLRNEQLQEIAQLSKLHEGNFIVAGDLNTSSYSRYFQAMLNEGNLRDSRKGYGILSSWPAEILPLRTTLDHFLIKGEMRVTDRTTERSIGSDHLPVFLKLEF